MENKNNPLGHFGSLPDHRDARYITHKLGTIIGISICAIICGAKDWYDIEDFGEQKAGWLGTFLDLGNGVPSHDTYQRFFGAVDADALEKCFRDWVASVATTTGGRVVHLDGKTIRGARDGTGKHFVHMVSAWCSGNGMVLGQYRVDEKSNEITAIPELLELLVVKGCTVTIDAMGCQHGIAKKITDREAHYILAVKDNQEFLHADIKEAFETVAPTDTHTHSNVGHGRIEARTTSIINDTAWVCREESWASIGCLVRVEAKRTDKRTGAVQQSTRYYIGSRKASAKFYNDAIRSHWAIENQLHWTLDVVFGEDAGKKRDGNSAQNFSLLNKIALNLLRNYNVPGYKGAKEMSIKRKRNIAAWANEHLIEMLFKKN